MLSYDVAIFDCDGVILNSNKIKSEAFRSALNDEPLELVDRFILYHQSNGGVSRYVKFRHYYTKIKINFQEEEINLALKKYANNVKKQLMVCSMIRGVEKYIKLLNDNGVLCYVNTGSDEEELKEIFKKRGLFNDFKAILGAPKNKNENILRIKPMIEGKKVVYFGDAKIDWEVSSKYNFKFIFISGVSEWIDGKKLAKSENFDTYEDFSSLIRKI